jgi:hypothetical protein
MKKNQQILQILGTLLFTVGVIAGMFLLIMMVWGDLEASLFSSGLEPEKTLFSLNCPVFISPKETGKITAKLKNPTENDWERFTRTNISEGFITLSREIKGAISIKAGSSQIIEWEVFPEDAAYDRIIFFRVYVNAKYPYPSLGGSCGIMLLDWWGFTGKQILTIMFTAFIFMTSIGFTLWKVSINNNNGDTQNAINAMVALAVIIFLGLFSSYLSAWVIGLLFLAAAMLMTGIIFGRRLSHKKA